MTIEEIQAALDQLVIDMMAKGVVQPRAEFTIKSGEHRSFSVALWCSTEEPVFDGGYLRGFYSRPTGEAALEAARTYISRLPDQDTKVMRTYLSKLADAVDYATEHSIADEFVEPVRLARAAMTDNLLPPPVEAAQ